MEMTHSFKSPYIYWSFYIDPGVFISFKCLSFYFPISFIFLNKIENTQGSSQQEDSAHKPPRCLA